MHAVPSFFGSNKDSNGNTGGLGGPAPAQPASAQKTQDAPYFGSQAPAAHTPNTGMRNRSVYGSSGSASVSRSGVLTVDSVPTASADDGLSSSDMPPGVSLLEMESSSSRPGPGRMNFPAQNSTPSSSSGPSSFSFRGGLDVGASRGLRLSSSGGYGSLTENNMPMEATGGGAGGVTSAVEVVSVSSPWVTVFGFPVGAGAAVLRYFQSFGDVYEHRSGAGNWMHILYASKVQAGRALARNGHFLRVGSEDVMLGVKPCPETTLGSVVPQNKLTRRLGTTANERYQVERDDDLRYRPVQVSSFCARVMAWMFDR